MWSPAFLFLNKTLADLNLVLLLHETTVQHVVRFRSGENIDLAQLPGSDSCCNKTLKSML